MSANLRSIVLIGAGLVLSRTASLAASLATMVEGPYSARFHHVDRGEIPATPAGRGGCQGRDDRLEVVR
jgi:hypothetical protein